MNLGPQAELQAFKLEIISIIDVVRALPSQQLRDEAVRERIRQIFITWTRSLSPIFDSTKVKNINEISGVLEFAARRTSQNVKKSEYLNSLKKVKLLIEHLILDLPKILPLIGDKVSFNSANGRFVQSIPDLPLNFVQKQLIGFKSTFEEFLHEHPYEKNVFIISRYNSKMDALTNELKKALTENDFSPIVAKEKSITDDLYNPVACLLCCKFGIVIFDQPDEKSVINPNVAYELGMMHMLQRKCLILKHSKLSSLPSDFLHKLYIPYKDKRDAASAVKTWLKEIAPVDEKIKSIKT